VIELGAVELAVAGIDEFPGVGGAEISTRQWRDGSRSMYSRILRRETRPSANAAYGLSRCGPIGGFYARN